MHVVFLLITWHDKHPEIAISQAWQDVWVRLGYNFLLVLHSKHCYTPFTLAHPKQSEIVQVFITHDWLFGPIKKPVEQAEQVYPPVLALVWQIEHCGMAWPHDKHAKESVVLTMFESHTWQIV